MEPLIRSLILRGFRSFAAQAIEFDNPTFLVGRNGTGKTTIADAFELLSDAMEAPLRACISRRGGLPQLLHRSSGSTPSNALGLGVGFGAIPGGVDRAAVDRARYAFEVGSLPNGGIRVGRERCEVWGQEPGQFDRQGSLTQLSVKLPAPQTEPDSLLLPLAGGFPQFAPVARTLAAIRAFALHPESLRGANAPDSGLSLSPDGSNAASVIREIQLRSPDDFEAVCDLLSAAMPYPLRVQPIQRGTGLGLEFLQDGRVVFDASTMSEGTLRMLGLLLLPFQRQIPSLVILEEPETSVHAGSLGVILDLLQILAERTQLIVTTHSPELLDAKWIEDRHLRLVTWEEGESRVRRLAEGSRKVLREHLAGAGDLLRSGALDAATEPDGEQAVTDLFHPAA